MFKCGDKFCSNPNIKSETDAQDCKELMMVTRPKWKGTCFFQRQGKGCDECGGKMIKGSGCSHCVECGWSKCS
jgi:hypothetical protein